MLELFSKKEPFTFVCLKVQCSILLSLTSHLILLYLVLLKQKVGKLISSCFIRTEQ